MIKSFDEVFEDVTKLGVKIKTDEYHPIGKYQIIDQGQEAVAGYSDLEDGVFENVPAIVFGDHTRIVKYVDQPFFLGADGVKVLRSRFKDANYRYLYYALKSVKIPNTGYNRHFKWLKEAKIYYPNSEEQSKIVSILDGISSVIEHRQQELQKLDELVKARFIELFGDPLGNDKGWQKVLITEVCHAIFGGGTPSKSHPEYFAGSIPWVSPKDMKSSVINDSIDHITEDAIAHSTTNLVPANSVLMVIRSGILKHTLPVAINSLPVTINQDMKAFVPNETVKTAFLLYFFKAIENDVLAGVRGVTADNIDFKAFQKRTIIVPPLALQEQFVAFVTQTDKSKVAVQKALDEAQLLFDSLMQKYFG
mgnify:CR=1 FL=1|jgi:hypothetical protein